MSAGSHLLAELREGLATFLKGLCATVALAVLLGLYLLVAVALPDPKLEPASKLLSLVIFPLYGAVQGLWLGAFVGAAAVLARIGGLAVLLPVGAALAGAGLAWTLGAGAIAGAWEGLVAAVGERSAELSGGGMGSCGSPVVLVVLVPILLLHYLGAPKILGAILWFVLVAAGLLLAGAAAGTGVSLPPLAWVVASRLRARARAREAAALVAPAAPAPPALA